MTLPRFILPNSTIETIRKWDNTGICCRIKGLYGKGFPNDEKSYVTRRFIKAIPYGTQDKGVRQLVEPANEPGTIDEAVLYIHYQ